MTLEQEIGNRVAKLRRQRGWSQDSLGGLLRERIGGPWSRQAIHSTEKGQRAFVAAEMVALAEVFKVPIEWLFGFGDMPACETCSDHPPPGFTCNDCGATGVRAEAS